MIGNLPNYISLVFGLTTLTTLLLFFITLKAAQKTQPTLKVNLITSVLALWLIVQARLALNNFYNTDTTSIPPKFIFLVLPPFLTILILFATTKGKKFIDHLPLKHLTYLNLVRIPVELVLYWLFLNQAIPELMTFEGRNFDILAGITAPFIAYFGLQQNKLGRKTVLIWNFAALALLLNIIINGVLSAPTAFQKFAFEQPNIALLNFPFVWLPCFIVPIVLFGHLVSIRRLLKET